MMKPVVFLDLDDTIFHSTRKRTPDTQDVGAVGLDGRPVSYLSRAQRALIDWFLASTDVVATTARSAEELSRVRLGLTGWKICANGAAIVAPDGGLDPTWTERLRLPLAVAQAPLHKLAERAERFGATRCVDLKVRLVSAGERHAYLRIRHRKGNVAELYDVIPVLREELPAGWTLTSNANNVSVLPADVGKANAVAWLRAHAFRDRLALGAGDSLSDRDFMACCDFAFLPVPSQLLTILRETPDDVQWKL